MERDRLPKHLLIGFALALGLYAAVFVVDNWTRTRKGPWVVNFGDTNGTASIIIHQKTLGISNVVVVFDGETTGGTNGTVEFNKPQKPVPFGKVKFEDLTYQPGSVVLDMFGHEVEMLPRTLYLNKKEHAWKSGETIVLKAGEKLPPGASYDPRKKKRRPFK